MLRALTYLMVVASLPLASPAAPPLRQPPRNSILLHAGSAILQGRVVDAASGQPVRKARVHAASNSLKDGRTAYTDGNGAFELSALPAGHYTVTAAKLGFVEASYGQPLPFEIGTPIDVADGQTVAHIDLVMSRAGVIAGRLTDEFGQPVVDTVVSAIRYRGAGGTQRLTSSSIRRTNDVGEFRIFGLAPGHYYLAATLQDNSARTDTTTREVYAATYYPGTQSVSTAQLLTVVSGQTISNVNMMLMAVRPVNVSGSVFNSSGSPVTHTAVVASLRVGPGITFTAPIRPDGSFTLTALSPAEYVLRVRGDGQMGNGESATMALTVGISDMIGVQIVTAKPIGVTGRVNVDRAELGSLPGSTFRLSTSTTPEDLGVRGNGISVVKDDFTFELKVPPGRMFIRSNTTGWFLRAVRVDGVDILDSGIEIRPNMPLKGVEIELTHRQPELTGVVRQAAGASMNAVYIIVFPQNRDRWEYVSRDALIERPNPSGEYRVLVPPGNYYVLALDAMAPDGLGDIAFLERVRERAIPVLLQDGDHKTLDLSVTTVAQP